MPIQVAVSPMSAETQIRPQHGHRPVALGSSALSDGYMPSQRIVDAPSSSSIIHHRSRASILSHTLSVRPLNNTAQLCMRTTTSSLTWTTDPDNKKGGACPYPPPKTSRHHQPEKSPPRIGLAPSSPGGRVCALHSHAPSLSSQSEPERIGRVCPPKSQSRGQA